MPSFEYSPILSFCIPTYNRAPFVDKCVKTILEYSNNDIEVIVCDNGSIDDTKDKLHRITDGRLKYYRNENNKGFQFNVDRVLNEAKGKFCFLISDEDEVNVESIPVIIDHIKQNQRLSLIYGGIFSKEEQKTSNQRKKPRIWLKGDEALSIIGFQHAYMSGIVLNRDMYQMIKESNEFWYQQYDTFYPHEYLSFRLAMLGNVLIMSDIIVWMNKTDNASETNYKNINSSYSYEGRLETYKQRISYIINFVDDINLRNKMILRNFRLMLYCGTINVYAISKNSALSKRLNLNSRKYNISEVNELIDSFFKDQIYYLEKIGVFYDLKKQTKRIYIFIKIKSIFLNIYQTPVYYTIKKVINKKMLPF